MTRQNRFASHAAAVLVVMLLRFGAAEAQARDDATAAAPVRTNLVREVTTTLASRRFEGRGTGQVGAERAADYIAAKFAAFGLQPGGDGRSFKQEFQVTEDLLLTSTRLAIPGHQFTVGEDFGVAAPPSPYRMRSASGDVVLVGYGVVAPELKHDDLAGIDVNGKLVMVLEGAPKNIAVDAWEKVANQQTVFGRLIQRGARGFLVVHGGDPQRFPEVAAFLSNRRVGFVENLRHPVAPARWSLELLYPELDLPPSLLVSRAVADQILASRHLAIDAVRAAAEHGGFVSRDLEVTASFMPNTQTSVKRTSNVIAVLEGSDPSLKAQAVVLTAHYDAYGIDARGTIFPGATDNALGVGKLLAVAERFAKQSKRPRRTIVFIATTGEEYGDLGLGHWLQHPTWRLEDVAADVNFDGSVTELWGEIGFVVNYGFGQSDLGPLVRRIAAERTIEVIPDPTPSEDYFMRGDHWAFVQRGIPALYLVGGPLDPSVAQRMTVWIEAHYHLPGDSVRADWKWDGPKQMAELGLAIARQIADAESLPQWRPGSRYNHPRGYAAPALIPRQP